MIREAIQADIGRLSEILVFAKRISYRAIFQDEEGSFVQLSVLSTAEQLMKPHALDGILVYEDGFVKRMAHLQCSQCEAELSALYVDPFFQGEAIGSSLLMKIEQYCQQHSLLMLRLWVLQENRKGIKFYERHGFFFTGRQAYETGTTVVKLEYQKKII